MADGEKNHKRMNSTMSSHDLPDDIMFVILSKSTVKSLLRFTGVSKSMNTLIKSSTFVAAHHHNQIHNKNNNKIDSYVISMVNDYRGDDDKDQGSCFLSREINARSKKYKLPFPFSSYNRVGISEGLVCFAKGSDVYIWNPFVGSMRQLPPNGRIRNDSAYLFDFSERSCDYKVMKPIISSDRSSINLEIYSLATDSWRRMEYKHSGWVLRIGMHILFNKFMYWMGMSTSSGHESREDLIRFDLDEEIFEKVAVSELPEAKLKFMLKSNETWNGVFEGDPDGLNTFVAYNKRMREYSHITLISECSIPVQETLMLFDKRDKI